MLSMMDDSMYKGDSNDRLVDFLVYYRYIRTRNVELAFRAVDRGDYILSTHAYISYPWKHGNIHLSAPTIYAKVLEAFDLQAGMSFLNIGSGTGYLSTVAGLLLKQHGTNHGIELHEDCLRYAARCLEKFKKSQALDKFDFCEPVFTQGNCLNLTPDRQYDRVYCGANCPEQYVEFIKKFVKVNGVLVMPFKGSILRFHRKTDTDWHVDKVLSVRFESLVVPTPEEQTVAHLPDYNPLRLQELCRGNIRNCLQEKIWQMQDDIETKYRIGLIREDGCTSDMVFNQFTGLYEQGPETAVSTKEKTFIYPDYCFPNICHWKFDGDSPSSDPSFTVIHINDDAFTAHMREKISQLPLPHTLKLYVNYNREL